jgi:hypothetical protein
MHRFPELKPVRFLYETVKMLRAKKDLLRATSVKMRHCQASKSKESPDGLGTRPT